MLVLHKSNILARKIWRFQIDWLNLHINIRRPNKDKSQTKLFLSFSIKIPPEMNTSLSINKPADITQKYKSNCYVQWRPKVQLTLLLNLKPETAWRHITQRTHTHTHTEAHAVPHWIRASDYSMPSEELLYLAFIRPQLQGKVAFCRGPDLSWNFTHPGFIIIRRCFLISIIFAAAVQGYISLAATQAIWSEENHLLSFRDRQTQPSR